MALPHPPFRICGVPVDFPFKPYGPQLAFMGKILAALEQSRLSPRSSSVNALLESPTGSGKTLALLCATLAWQQHFLTLPLAPPSVSDPLLAGGGFLVDEPSSGPESREGDTPAVDTPTAGRFNNPKSKNRKVPIIYYASRTHTQITQVIRELRKTKYRVSMAVLGARRHYCTNKHVAHKNNVDEDCKLLMKDEQRCCPQFKNVSKLKTHPSLQKGGSNDIHDIEDLVGLGHKVKGCAYFAARALATDADIVFCPYSYILDPIIRSAMEVNLQGAIVVLDEAHNIEDVAREAGSIDLETSLLQDLRLELEQLATSDETVGIYSPLLEMVQALLDWVYHQEKSLSKLDFEHYASSWRGTKAVQELRVAGTCLETFQVLIECSKKAVAAASNPDETVDHLSGRAAIAIEGLFSALKFMLLNNGRRAGDYQLVVRKFVKRDEGLAVAGWVTTVSLWCLNPGVVFENIASSTRSIILTSGTLSPMDSFASELGVPFEIQMEAPHVVDMDKQVWAAAVSTGPDNVSLNASYKNADGYAFQDALGLVLEEVFKVVPDGALTFFPSYKFLDKLCARWKSTGQWDRLSNVKELFVEPRGNNDQFELVLQDFYNSVNPERASDRNKKAGAEKKRHLKRRGTSRSTDREPGGAAFLAVCRGKVSEGIDFSDKNARIVVIVGIPFPNVKDIQVTLKKQYNQENRTLKNLLSGDEWYCQQTFRALNQAVGRCIRHRNDYGAILLLDERFKKPGNIQYMSKWLRKSIRQCESFRESLEGLKAFFKGFETMKTSSDVMKDLCIVPTVKSSLVSTHKAKLLMTSSTKKPGNQPSLRDYVTKTSKTPAASSSREPNLSSRIRSTAKDQANIKISQKIATGRESPQFPPEQQSKRHAVQPRQVLGTIVSSNPETAELNVVASHMLEDFDSEYETYSLRNDGILGAKESDIEYLSKEEHLEVDNVVTQGCDDHTSIQSPKTASAIVTSSDKPFEPTRSGEMPRKTTRLVESSINGLCQNRNKHSMKRKMDPADEETTLDMRDISQKRSNSLGLEFSVQFKTESENLQANVSHIGKRMHDCQRGTRCSSGLEPGLPDNDHSRAEHVESRLQRGHSDCDNTFVSTERVDSELYVSCSGKDNNSAQVAILCGSCSSPFTNYAKVAYESYNKSYLTTLYSGDIQSIKVPVILMEYHNLHFLVKENLPTSIPPASLPSDKSGMKNVLNGGVWIREDGCVYEHIYCPHCEDQSICVGVHVAACDKMNLQLMDKVLFFEEHVKVINMCRKEVQQGEQKAHLSTTRSDYSANVKPVAATPAKAKLKLQRTKI